MSDKSSKGLIVLSGGMDSVTLLYDKIDEIAYALSFDYGSKHNGKELAMAKWHTKKVGIPHIIIPLSFMNAHFRSDLLKSGGDIPSGAYNEDNMKNTVVPFRNGIMLAIASGLAESYKLKKVFIANHFGDHAIYPDCRSSFINPMKDAINNGTTNNVELVAPYTDITKNDIACIAARLKVDIAHTYSCYRGGDKHCGECSTCIERKDAIRNAGMEDPTEYEK